MDRFLCENIAFREGRLTFAGMDTVALAQTYGTPLYLMDEARIRHNCRVYTEAFRKYFREGSKPFYASKACAFMAMYRIVQQEGMGVEVVSGGELYTALKAGVDPENISFNSNNKTDEDIRFAIENGIGCFVVDNEEELRVIEETAAGKGICQKVLLRLTPGIDPHTYAAMDTGEVDSKFGTAIETGQAEQITAFALAQKHIDLIGFHCHVGSQVFTEDVFERSAVIMLEYIAHIRDSLGYTAPVLNLGGGYGVRYLDSDPYLDIDTKIASVAETVKDTCERLALPVPLIEMEPGRSIVADAGMTLYTVGTIKRIPGYKNYVSVDGGMADNPRFALYGARYVCFTANKVEEERTMTADLVGRCCESGDILIEKATFPEGIRRGDIVAVCTTGAYNYSMASNYNRLGRPPVIMLKDGQASIAVKRETPEDLIRLDV